MASISARSMLDIELPETEDPSDAERGGVSPPELEVQVLERDREAGGGRVKTGTGRTELMLERETMRKITLT